MKIELFNDSFPWGLFTLWTLVVWGVLARILTRNDLDVHQKLLWVVVVIFVPFFGVVLYCFASPAAPRKPLPPLRNLGPIIPGSDVSGTPWAGDSSYTHRREQ